MAVPEAPKRAAKAKPSAKRKPAAGASVAIAVDDVAKAFGATQAIRTASMDLREGEVHCIVGENGSGKSTLVKILAGVHRPDSGTFDVAGQTMTMLKSPQASLAAGISVVFQEVLVVEPRSVLENVWLGTDELVRTNTPVATKEKRANEILTELLGHPLQLHEPVQGLSLSHRQSCCIARALVRDPKVLILDESTSALDVETRDRLFKVLRRLTAEGTSVIFISHRMDEIADIGDRCTVMRSGETVATLGMTEATPAELVRLMTGAEHLAPTETRKAAASAKTGGVALSTKDLVLREGCAPINVDVRSGELVGVAGLEGHGQDAFIKALWGLGAVSGEVVSELDGEERPIRSPEAASACGIGYVPRERRAESMFESKSIRENFAMPTLDRDVRHQLIHPADTRARLNTWVERLGIKLASPEDLITVLSGGNQQKIVMARWLATEPRVLLLNDPTRGVDIGAKRDIYKLLTDLAEQGVAIVMLSTEVDEHVELMDRVLVFREHELSSELPRRGLSRTSLVASFFGQEAA